MLELSTEESKAKSKHDLEKAIQNAKQLAKEIGHIPLVATVLIDTGAGFHVKAYTSDLSLAHVDPITVSTANGPAVCDKTATLKFRNLEDQTCLVLDNAPDLLSVGQLVAQGYAFHWTPGVSEEFRSSDQLSLDALPGEIAVLVTPDGREIKLHIYQRVPYLNDDDCASEPDIEVHNSTLR